MPIDLQKYDGKYVQISCGSIELEGKLIGNTLFEYYLGDDTVYPLHKQYEINEHNISAIRDMTSEIYTRLCDRIAFLETNPFPDEDGFFKRQLEQNKKVKTEIEKIFHV